MISKSRLTGLVFVFLSLMLSFNSCTASVTAPSEGESVISSQNELKNKVIMHVYNYMKEKKMTVLDDRCLSYDFDDSDSEYFSVSVRETNRHGVCGSDPDISAVLFNFHINKKGWEMSTDAFSTDGSFSLAK